MVDAFNQAQLEKSKGRSSAKEPGQTRAIKK
jgi:hypothetical protein